MKKPIHLLPCLLFTGLSAQLSAQWNVLGGYVLLDTDGNGVISAGDVPLPGYGVHNAPANEVTGTDYYGQYFFIDSISAAHTDTLSLQVPLLGASVVPSEYILNIPPGITFYDTSLHFLVQLPLGTIDASGIFMSPWPSPAPGRDQHIGLLVTNLGNTVADINVAYQGDTTQTWLSSTVPPTTQNGMNATWFFPQMAPMEQQFISLIHGMDTATVIGTPLNHAMQVSTAGDSYVPNNADSLHQVVVGSYDPNYKTVDPPMLTGTEAQVGRELEYAIHFQNTGTAPAVDVAITDTLDARIAAGPIEFVASSHYCTWSRTDDVLRFQFNYINLPDSGANEPGSHGFVQFRAHSVPGLSPQEGVPNSANIYFDFNPPVITEPCWFFVEAPAAVEESDAALFNVYPNPTTGQVVIDRSKNGTAQLLVLDLSGRLVQEHTLAGPRQMITLSDLASGMYVLRLATPNGREISSAAVLLE